MHATYKFSITVYSSDLAVVGCLRALAQFSQQTGNNRIPWGGTKDGDWKRAGEQVTFRFSTPAYRQGFVDVATRVLGAAAWDEVSRSDKNPALPQGR